MINGVLKNQQDVDCATQGLLKLKLKSHSIPQKCWDGYRMISFIQQQGNVNSKVLDVGCIGSPILHWLSKLGFKNLYGCDLAPWWSWRRCLGLTAKLFLNPKIQFKRENLENTTLDSGSFDFITSLSVIEHGVVLDAYFKEMARLLKKGGILLTSTDYWPTHIDTRGVYLYGKKWGEMKIFTEDEILNIIDIAKSYHFELVEPLDLSAQNKMVTCMNLNYTFALFTLRKIA